VSTQSFYLRHNVQVEPLVDHWYAWPHLIPPATAARNMTERHLPIMESYVSAPEVHTEAVRNPRMRGGPFIDLGGERVDEISALAKVARHNRPHLNELSCAIGKLDEMLRTLAKGYSLEPLYPNIPRCLRGYVELCYDLNNHPSFRLLEPLLYRSCFYDCSLQSIMLSIITGDERPFVLSTPRLESQDRFHWKRPFADADIDEVFRLKMRPQPIGRIREMLNWSDDRADLCASFLTSDRPEPYKPYRGPTARWRYFGHACVLVETARTSVLFDPVLSYTYESNVSRYTYADLPDVIDYVLITHDHQDHILFETLLQIRHKVRHVIVPPSSGHLHDPSLRLMFKRLGFTNIIELDEMESIKTVDGSIMSIPFFGEHSDLNIRSKAAYVVRVGEYAMMFAADSCNIEPMLYRHLHAEIGDVHVLFLGMECIGAPLTWLYGPLLSRTLDRQMDQSRRLAGSNYEQAMQIVSEFNCREVYVYAMGQEPWLNYVMSLKYTETSKPILESNKLLRECHNRGIMAERLFGEREMFVGPS